MREEEKKRSSQDSSVKRFFKKRWVYPAIYIASAAIILTAVLWYQNSNDASDSEQYKATDLKGKNIDEPAVEVNRAMENFVMPVTDPDSVEIQKQFYDDNGSKEEQVAALVFYNNTYYPNTGIDITSKDGKTFDVVAALSGTVTNVNDNDTMLGNVIEIEHDKGIVTQYQSVKDIKVKVGDQVEQGQALATAGQSLYNEEAGVHVHFEIRKENVAVNPLDYFNKPFSALQEADVTKTKEATDDSGKSEEGKATEESKNSDMKKESTDSKATEESKETPAKTEDTNKQSTDDQSGTEESGQTDEDTKSDENSQDDSSKTKTDSESKNQETKTTDSSDA